MTVIVFGPFLPGTGIAVLPGGLNFLFLRGISAQPPVSAQAT